MLCSLHRKRNTSPTVQLTLTPVQRLAVSEGPSRSSTTQTKQHKRTTLIYITVETLLTTFLPPGKLDSNMETERSIYSVQQRDFTCPRFPYLDIRVKGVLWINRIKAWEKVWRMSRGWLSILVKPWTVSSDQISTQHCRSRTFSLAASRTLTAKVSSGSCMVMQSMLIWMVFPAEPSLGPSVKFSSMGWIEWMADLKQQDIFIKSWSVDFIVCNITLLTYWSNMSKSWLNTPCPDVCDGWLWDVAVRNEPSVQDKRDVGSLSLHTGDKNIHRHILLSDEACFNKSLFEMIWRERTLSRAGDVKIWMIWPPSRGGGSCTRGASIVKKSACIILNICTTHNGDYAPFRQGLFDPLPLKHYTCFRARPAIVPAEVAHAAVWDHRNFTPTLSTATSHPQQLYTIALLQLLVCVQLDWLGGAPCVCVCVHVGGGGGGGGGALIWS